MSNSPKIQYKSGFKVTIKANVLPPKFQIGDLVKVNSLNGGQYESVIEILSIDYPGDDYEFRVIEDNDYRMIGQCDFFDISMLDKVGVLYKPFFYHNIWAQVNA